MAKKKVDMSELFNELQEEYDIEFESITNFALNYLSVLSVEKLKEVRKISPTKEKDFPGLFTYSARINGEKVIIQVFIGEPPKDSVVGMDPASESEMIH